MPESGQSRVCLKESGVYAVAVNIDHTLPRDFVRPDRDVSKWAFHWNPNQFEENPGVREANLSPCRRGDLPVCDSEEQKITKIRKYQTSLLSSCTFLLRGLKHFKDIGVHSHHWQVPLFSRTAKLPLLSFLRETEQTKCEAIWKLPCLRWSLLEDRTRVGLHICFTHPIWQLHLCVPVLLHGEKKDRSTLQARGQGGGAHSTVCSGAN